MVSLKTKLLFGTSIIGMIVLICAIYWPPGASVGFGGPAGIIWANGIVVSGPMALVGLAITGISCSIIVRDIRMSLAKYEKEIKAHSTPLNEALYYMVRAVLGGGLGCLASTFIFDNWIQTNIGLDLSQATPALIHYGVIIAEQEFLFAIVGMFLLIFGLFLEAVRLENIIWYMKLKSEGS